MHISFMHRIHLPFPVVMCVCLAVVLLVSGCAPAKVPVIVNDDGAASQESASDVGRSANLQGALAMADPSVAGGNQAADDEGAKEAPSEAEQVAFVQQEDIPNPFPGAQKAPSFEGAEGWLNTAGPLELKDLRGKFVLLDFWTYCCINCMHILPELKKLEKAYPNELVVIGVHSAKFDTEQDLKNIKEAILRYEIEHPVVNDSNHTIWNKYRISSWPSLRIIDPDGNLVAGDSGEVTFDVLDRFMKQVLPYYRKKGSLDETPLRFDLETYSAEPTPLRFPGKVLADESGNRLFIADSNHNRIVVSSLSGELLDIIGKGTIGTADGDFATAEFNHPQGMYLHKDTLYVADTENHMLRKVDLKSKKVETVSGTGEQARGLWPGMSRDPETGQAKLPKRFVSNPKTTALNSPWALWVHGDQLYIAMAGPHQIWRMPLDEREIGPYAGNGREDIVDGPLLPSTPYEAGYSSFAQPSGLASDGKWLYVADSEGSSIRAVPFSPKQEVETVIGTAHLMNGRLFTFGDVDGKGPEVRLQHCIGVAYADGKLYLADTYNNKIKELDLKDRTVTTLAGTGEAGSQDSPAQFDEPAGVSVAAGKVYVADTNNHRIRVIDLANGNAVSTLEIAGLKPFVPPQEDIFAEFSFGEDKDITLAEQSVKPVDGHITFDVQIKLADGWKINPLAPTSYKIEATTEKGPIDRTKIAKPVKVAEKKPSFAIQVPLAEKSGTDKIKVTLTYYYCQDGAEGLCKIGQQTWVIPVKVDEAAKSESVQLTASAS